MAEVELRHIGTYTITTFLRTSPTNDYYLGKHAKKEVLVQRLKTPLPNSDDKKVFLTHARQLKKLRDRAIVNLLDVLFDGDYAYLFFEPHAEQTMLDAIPPGTQLAPDKVKTYLSPIATALHNAHTHAIVHGNLYPGTIFFDPASQALQIGNFALMPPDSIPSLDDEEHAIPYMAPERLQEKTTSASDQYSLAVMAYEWLCGQRPFPATQHALLQQQQQQPVPSLRTFNDHISSAVEQVVLRALSVDQYQRFPHIQAFSTAYLRALMGLPFDTLETTSSRLVVPASFPTQATTNSKTLKEIDGLATKRQQQAIIDNEIIIASSVTSTQSDAAIDRHSQNQPINEHDSTSSNQDPSSPSAPHHSLIQEKPLHEQQIQHTNQSSSRIASASDEKDQQVEEQLPDEATFTGTHLQHIVEEDLRQGGVLSQSLPGYEERLAQIEMATLVSQAISQRTPAIIEAATGTGKSLAYLVPIVRSGQVAIVSTANKALQEQLYYKDIPFVQKHIKHFEAALVKGVNNYICLDRLENERIGMQAFAKNRDFQHLYEYINDPDTGLDFTGDFETLGFQLPRDIRSRIATESDQCAWKKCDFFEDCYVREMREHAEQAQIIVVNHTLLLLDAAMDGFLLPERDLIVLDEAHHLEEEATRSFTITIHPNQIQTLLAQHLLKNHSLLSLQDETMRAAQTLWSQLEQTINPGFKGRANLERPFEEGLRLATTLDDLADSLRKQRPKDLPDKDGQLYDKLVKRTQNLADNVRTVFSVAEPNKFVYYVERVEGSQARGFVFQASAAPLDVTSWLQERLFKKCNVIATSATLATVSSTTATTPKTEAKGPNFTYFRRRIGLDPLEYPDVLESVLPLTFDYEQNALLYLPRDLPAPTFGPGAEDYMTDIAREMYRLVKLSRGRAFLLFSSKRMLDFAFELMAPHLPYPLLKQGDMTRMELTRRFREEEGAVLFGLKSFWEGVDIAGDALSLVVIDKLPFDPPDDPVHEARVAQMKAAGENWFGNYVLPQAVLRLKQGIGRLLRTREDRGVMAILDTRLHTKGYGRQVLNALPPARRSSNIRDVDRFFSAHPISG